MNSNIMGTKYLSFFVLFLIAGFTYGQPQTINLSGTWQFAMDSLNKGEGERWFLNELPQQIKLPGSTDQAGYGRKHVSGTPLRNGEPEIWGLARKHTYIGPAWYQRKLEIPDAWDGKQLFLFLERCMWQSKLWVNDAYAGENHSLCAPHTFDITPFIRKGENTLTLCIDNSPYVHLGSWSHGYAPGIQTIWNGAVGEIQLIVKDPVYLAKVQTYPSYKEQKIRVKGHVVTDVTGVKEGTLKFIISDKSSGQILAQEETLTLKGDTTGFETTIEIKNRLKPWDEFHPNLYTLEVKSKFGDFHDDTEVIFGVRDIESTEGRFVINGYNVFMRGEHEAGSFSLTGYPSMKKADWIRIFKIGKEHGLNHWRFHSWCPPKAAFEAADETGIYLQPELTLFSQDWEHTLVGTDAARDAFLFSELKKLLDTYGNHPSFVLMCMGNELRGDHEVLEKWVAWGKKHDPRHLYAGNANLEAMGKYERLQGDDFQVAHAGKHQGKRVARRMFSYFNNENPNTVNDYSHTLQPPFDQWPVISHEVGQWMVYPDYSEIPRYKGVLTPRNMEVFKSRLEQKGMANQAKDFLMASGKLSALLYREEMERLLRTPKMGGFQLLDLRDYQAQGSALVGMLNAFWESKGFITAEEFRESCNVVTLLLKMPKRVWLNHETFHSTVVVPNYSASHISDLKVNWEVTQRDKALFSGQLTSLVAAQGDVNHVGEVAFSLNTVDEASKLTLHLEAPELGIANNYDFWVYPEKLPEEKDEGIMVATKATSELLQKIREGASVLFVPGDHYDAERTTFTTPFWSTILFDYQIKTMGLLCNPDHPVFNHFPTDFYTNWQWWELTRNAYAARLNMVQKGYKPIVQVIDHPVRNDKLGALMETRVGKGKLFIVTFDILSDLAHRPVARQLKYSISRYMKSRLFDPPEIKGLHEVFFGNEQPPVSYAQIKASNEISEHPVIFAFDRDENTWWQTREKNQPVVSVEIELKRQRYITGCTLITGNENTRPGKFKVYVTNDKENIGDPIIIGNGKNEEVFDAEMWDNGFTIQKGKQGKYIFISFEPIPVKESVMKLSEIKWIFGD